MRFFFFYQFSEIELRLWFISGDFLNFGAGIQERRSSTSHRYATRTPGVWPRSGSDRGHEAMETDNPDVYLLVWAGLAPRQPDSRATARLTSLRSLQSRDGL